MFSLWSANGEDPDERIGANLALFPGIEAKFRSEHGQFVEQFQANIGTFRMALPDFDDDIDIYDAYVIGLMDGAALPLDGKQVLVFGIDGMVRYHTSLNFKPLFHHELFHIYHDQRAPSVNDLPDFSRGLWAEGLAVYASRNLNPDATNGDILIPDDLVAACEQKRGQLIPDILSKLDSNSPADYAPYFKKDTSDALVPPRAGYYFGYLVAQKLAERHTLREMAALDSVTLNGEIRSALQELLETPNAQ